MTTKAVTCSWDRERSLALLSVFGKSAAVKCLCCTISSSGIALWHRFLESFKSFARVASAPSNVIISGNFLGTVDRDCLVFANLCLPISRRRLFGLGPWLSR